MEVTLTVISIVLAILVVTLLAFLNKRTHEKEYWQKQEKRAWMLKIALEKSCELPTVEAQELAKIEPQIDQMMNGQYSEADLEEKMRELIMSLYEEKVKARGQGKETAKKDATPKDNNTTRRPPNTGRG